MRAVVASCPAAPSEQIHVAAALVEAHVGQLDVRLAQHEPLGGHGTDPAALLARDGTYMSAATSYASQLCNGFARVTFIILNAYFCFGCCKYEERERDMRLNNDCLDLF